MAHSHDDTLAAVKADFYPNAADVSQVYSDDDTQWWVEDSEHNTIAYAWYDDADVLNARDYHP